MPKVSVVIRAFNEAHHIGRLLLGLQAQTVQAHEIIVVDSGSSDSTIEIAQRFGCRVVNIPKEEFSFGRSLNYGCETSEGDILLIVSAHVYPTHRTYLENMIAPFSDDRVAISYGRQVGDHRTKFSEARIMLSWFPEESIWDQGHPFSNNANAAVRRAVWAAHKYDEQLTGLEDLEFANRVIKDGSRISYVAEASVVHVHEETWRTIQNRYRREAIAYSKIVDESRMPAYRAALLALANIGSDYSHAVREGSLLPNIASIPKFRAAQFYGAWQGFRTRQVNDQLLRRFYYPGDRLISTSAKDSDLIDYASLDDSKDAFLKGHSES